ncbi:MAG: group II truncated hemoglobin [Proteobacteria bacterium]|nr:group II truncated hemoglobin [Pseudomonadota bacterium]
MASVPASSVESLYHRLGGEPVLKDFVAKLYGFMEVLPEVESIRNMHAQELSHTRDRVFMFLSGMLGGPPLYMEAFGHPRLRRKHLRFEIGNQERDQWMLCAQRAADELAITSQLREELIDELAAMANHLRNTADTDQAMPRCIVNNADNVVAES